MKYIVLLGLQLTIGFTAVCQAPHWTDFKLFAGQSHDDGNAIAVDKHDNTYLAVSSQNPLSSFTQETLPEICNFIQPIWGNLFHGAVYRFDSSRNLTLSIVIEQATLGDIAVDDAGNIYVSGLLQHGAFRDAFVKKYSSTGDLVWSKSVEGIALGRHSDNFISSLAISPDGSLALCGFGYGEQVSLFGQPYAGPLGFVTKMNQSGEVIWTQRISKDLGYGASRVKFDASGDVLVTGNEKAAGTSDLSATIAKLSGTTGNVVWKKQFRSTGLYVPRGTAISTAGGHYVFGGTFGGELTMEGTTVYAQGGLDIFLLSCDKDGTINWLKTAGSGGRETLYDLVEENGIIYLTGGFSDGFQLNGTSYASKGNTDVYIGALDKAGNTLWVLTGGSSLTHQQEDLVYDEKGASIAFDSKGHLQVAGTTIGSGNFGSLTYKASEKAFTNAFWLTLGNNTSTYTVYYPCDRTSVLDLTFSVYPNPFDQSLTITNSQGLKLDYSLVLTNSIGQKVAERFFPASSTFTVEEWHKLAVGVYFLKIDTNNHSTVVKLVKK